MNLNLQIKSRETTIDILDYDIRIRKSAEESVSDKKIKELSDLNISEEYLIKLSLSINILLDNSNSDILECSSEVNILSAGIFLRFSIRWDLV